MKQSAYIFFSPLPGSAALLTDAICKANELEENKSEMKEVKLISSALIFRKDYCD